MKKFLEVQLAELDRIRLSCPQPDCGGVAEFSVKIPNPKIRELRCPVCDFVFTPSGAPRRPFAELVEAIRATLDYSNGGSMSFLVEPPE